MKCFVLALLTLVAVAARGQSNPQVVHNQRCDEFLLRSVDAMHAKNYQAIVTSMRAYLAECSDLSTKETQAEYLEAIGNGLIHLGQSEDALPVLRRCTTLNPDNAMCWEKLGEGSASLNRRADAKAYWRKTIEIGGFTEMNARAVDDAKERLAWLAEDEMTSGAKLPPDPSAEPPQEPSRDTSPNTTAHTFGTGFFVTYDGAMLTNDHVVAGCRTIATRDGKGLKVLARNKDHDLALLKADYAPGSVAIFRSGPAPRLGDSVVAFGFPLPGILSSEGNLSTGVLSATSGLQNDVRFVQISAPVQPGSSGGPLFDVSGHVIGVVVAKLDALQVAQAIGDVPQNVNFAVHWAGVRAFLDEAGVRYRKEVSQRPLDTGTIAATASKISVAIDCTK